MKRIIISTFVALFFAVCAPLTASAGDFQWMADLNIKASTNIAGFKADLCTRFNLGEAQVNAVVTHVEKPADAYMVLRLGEMASKPPETVIETYKTNRTKGWGVMAKELGIKPGSKEFHALKNGYDLYDTPDAGSGKKDKGNKGGKGHGKGHGKWK
jgi:hypothetical protein